MSTVYTPKPYQDKLTAFILNIQRCAAHVDMGLGKTVATLAAIKQLRSDNKIKAALVLAPLKVATITWPDEIEKWTHTSTLTTSVICGTPKQRIAALSKKADIYLCNYDVAPWLCQWIYDNRKNLPFDMVVLDESSRFKDGTTKRFKAMKTIFTSEKFSRVVELTGTPAPEGYEGLWSQFYLLDKGERLEKYITHYRQKYFIENRYCPHMRSIMPGAKEIIQDKIKGITFTLLASDWLDLPPVVFNTIYYEQSERSKALAKDMQRGGVVEIGDTVIIAENAAVVLAKQQQLAHGFIYSGTGPDRKTIEIDRNRMGALADLIDGIGQNVLVAYNYERDQKLIRERFPHCPILGSGTNAKQAAAIVKRWNAGALPVLFMHPASVGHGMNLQHGGNHLIFYTAPWSCELFEQTIARLHRTGQDNGVMVHYLSSGEFDDDLLTALQNKAQTQHAFKHAMRKYIPEKIP